MKIVIAPDSYKESLSALEVATQIEAGFREVFPEWSYTKVPVADGGEGTVEALVAATGGRVIDCTVSGPLGTPVQAFFGLTGDGRTAVIEMAAASGLALVPPAQRAPLQASTAGVGELILAALDAGARRFIIGIGGSATNDGGAGMAQALGARLLDARNEPIGAGGGALAALARIETDGLDVRLQECHIEVACDVDNPLIGPTGASAVFGPQRAQRRPWCGSSMPTCSTTPTCSSATSACACTACPVAARPAGWALRWWRFWARSCGPAWRSWRRRWAWTPPLRRRIWSSPAKAASTARACMARPRWGWRGWRSTTASR